MSNWTLSNKGAKQVPIVGLDDKREITAVLAVTMSGETLPPQLIYTGSTVRCHPKDVNFPDDWDIWHSANHWSNESTMLRYLDEIIIPYMAKVRPNEAQKGLCIFDVFAAHLCESVLNKMRQNNLIYVTIPAGCTSELQPLDLTVNQFFKAELKNKFHNYYAEQVQKELASSSFNETQPVSLQLTLLKPIHAGWVIDCFASLQTKPDLIRSGFRKAGLLPTSESEADTLPPYSDNEATVEVIALSDSDDNSPAKETPNRSKCIVTPLFDINALAKEPPSTSKCTSTSICRDNLLPKEAPSRSKCTPLSDDNSLAEESSKPSMCTATPPSAICEKN